MDSPASALAKTLCYSANFDYPLTLEEVWFWQIGTTFSKSHLKKHYPKQDFTLRHHRQKFSQAKWQIANSIAQSLSRLVTIQAIFVTGSLAMNNSCPDDDIDLMLVTSPNTLWLTRLLVFLLLRDQRRPHSLPEHASHRVSDKICDNLYLETHNLQLTTNNLYIAHEILQAKCIFDRSNIAYQFISSNPWVEDYLPIAYRETLKKTYVIASDNNFQRRNLFLESINLICFAAQYIYMKPKITAEKITLHSAFFHPRKNPLDKKILDLV